MSEKSSKDKIARVILMCFVSTILAANAQSKIGQTKNLITKNVQAGKAKAHCLLVSVVRSTESKYVGKNETINISENKTGFRLSHGAKQKKNDRKETNTTKKCTTKKSNQALPVNKTKKAKKTIALQTKTQQIEQASDYVVEEKNILIEHEDVTLGEAEFAPHLAEQLSSLPSLRTVRQGGALQEQNVRIRGLGGARLRLELDGIPLGDPSGYPLDLAGLDSALVQDATIYTGAQSGALGPGAIGGVIALRSPDVQPGFHTLERTEIGAYGLISQRGQVQCADDENQWQLSLFRGQSQGDFIYRPITYSGDQVLLSRPRQRFNNDQFRQQASLKYRHIQGQWSSSTLLMWQQSQGGIAGLSGHATPLSRQSNSSLMLSTGTQYFFSRGMMTLKTMLRQKSSWAGLQGLFGVTESREEMRTLWAQASIKYLEIAGLFDLAVLFEQQLFLNAQGSGVSSSAELLRNNFIALSQERRRWGQAMALRFDRTIRNKVALSLQMRWDGILDGQFATNELLNGEKFIEQPGGAARLSWAIFTHLALDVSLGRSFRAPSFFEQYGASGEYFMANESLRPETGMQAETALRWRGQKSRAGIHIFAARMDETILFLNRNAYELRPENTGALWRSGVECSANISFGSGFQQGFVAEYLWTRLDLSGGELPNTPALRFWSRSSWQQRVMHSQFVFKSYFDAQARSTSHGNLFGELGLPAQAIVNLGVAMHAYENSFISCQILNVLDAQSRMDMRQVPLPGRTWRCMMQVGL